MSDIVEMLRTPTGAKPPSQWELKAAAEIERLRAALFKIQCEQLDRATNTVRSARSHRALAMGTRDRIIEVLHANQ
jgi:hypothetical protein